MIKEVSPGKKEYHDEKVNPNGSKTLQNPVHRLIEVLLKKGVITPEDL